MLLDLENKFYNTEPFIWTSEEIKYSRTVLEKIINEQEQFLNKEKKEFLESLITLNQIDDDTLTYFYEKNKWITELFETNILNSLFVLININVENYLRVIIIQLQSIKNENKISKKFIKRNSFGTNWKLEYQDYLLVDLNSKIDSEWELINALYKLRNKISHSGCYINENLKNELERLNFKGIEFYKDENKGLFFVKINFEFLKEALARLIDTLFDLMDNTYKRHCLD